MQDDEQMRQVVDLEHRLITIFCLTFDEKEGIIFNTFYVYYFYFQFLYGLCCELKVCGQD